MSLYTLVGLSEFPLLWTVFSYFPIYFISVYVFLLSCSSLYILENIPLSVLDIANTVSQSFLYLQILLMMHFIENKSFWYNKKKILFKCHSHPKLFLPHIFYWHIVLLSLCSLNTQNTLLIMEFEVIQNFFFLILSQKEDYNCRFLWGTKK